MTTQGRFLERVRSKAGQPRRPSIWKLTAYLARVVFFAAVLILAIPDLDGWLAWAATAMAAYYVVIWVITVGTMLAVAVDAIREAQR